MTVSGDFNNSATFYPNGRTLILAGSTGATVTSLPTLYNLTITKDSNASVAVAGALLNVANNLSISNAAHLNTTTFGLTVGGTTNIDKSNGSVSSSDGALVFGNDVDVDTMTSAGSVSSTSGVILFNSAVTSTGYIQTNTGALTFNGAVSNAGSIYLNAGIASSTRSFINEVTTGILNLGSGAVTTTAVFTNNNDVIGGSGTFDAQTDYLGSGTFSADTSLFKFSGTVSRNSNLADAYRFQNNVTSDGVVTMTRDLAITNTYDSVGANTLDAGAYVLDLGGVTNIGLSTTVTSTIGTINFTNTVGNVGKIGTLSGNLLFTNALTNTGEIHVGSGNASTTGALAFNNNTGGTLFLESGHTTSTVDMNNNGGTINGGESGTLDLTNTFTNTGGFFSALGSTLVLSGTENLTLPAYPSYNNIIASKTSNGTVTAGGAIVVDGFLTVSDSTKFEMNGSTLDVKGATNITASTAAVTSTSG
ncbi:MAG: hypothetical protein AAB393_12585, partial [Bacteroidota bacterium]